jgi:hypothetical protein
MNLNNFYLMRRRKVSHKDNKKIEVQVIIDNQYQNNNLKR